MAVLTLSLADNILDAPLRTIKKLPTEVREQLQRNMDPRGMRLNIHMTVVLDM